MIQDAWTFLISNFSESTIWVATSLLHTSIFIVFNCLLYLFDKYSLFQRYKIQKNNAPSNALVSEALWEVTKKHLIGALWFWLLIPLARYTQIIDKTDPTKTPNDVLPSFKEVALHVLFFIIVQDTIFYWSHRALHLPVLYKRYHKYHHRFHTNIGIASEFAHPLEDLANTIAISAGPFFLGTHLFTLWVWFFIRIWETIDAHSGYAFPFPLSPFSLFDVALRHDFHHSHNQGCYGSFFGIWDILLGTDSAYREWNKSQKEGKTEDNKKKANNKNNKKDKAEQLEKVSHDKKAKKAD